MTVTDALTKRRATPAFDPTFTLTKEELFKVIETANLAPSSMNLQPWELVVFSTEEEKQSLLPIAMNQPKVVQASHVIAVIGNTSFYKNAERLVESRIEKGYMKPEGAEAFVAGATGYFKDNAAGSRDEAFRGAVLWAMSFMLAATEAGYDTAPMSGFFPDKFSEAYGLPEDRVPIMLIAIGKANSEVKLLERDLRFPAADLVHQGSW